MHICFVVEGYPYPNDPQMPFIQQLVLELARQNVVCSVIAPQSITRSIMHHVPLRPSAWIDSANEAKVTIYQPRYISLSNFFLAFNRFMFSYSAKRAYKRIKDNIDILYSHFWHMAMIADYLEKNKPLFLACGESKISVCDKYGAGRIKKMVSRVNGVIYVGTKSFNEAEELHLQDNQPYIIAPNGYDEKVFYKKDKASCRKELGWSAEDFVVAFVGSFIERKGVNELCEALNTLKKNGIKCKACFIGSGPIHPSYSEILYCGKVNHERIGDYLCASDVFVLPTRNEGCCNAIIEALACGLPVISSDLPFNDDVLDESNSIRINPLSSEEIAAAIRELYSNSKKRESLANGAITKADQLKLSSRASRIISFIESNR